MASHGCLALWERPHRSVRHLHALPHGCLENQPPPVCVRGCTCVWGIWHECMFVFCFHRLYLWNTTQPEGWRRKKTRCGKIKKVIWIFDNEQNQNSWNIIFLKYHFMVQEGGAAVPHVWPDGHLLLHRRLLLSMVGHPTAVPHTVWWMINEAETDVCVRACVCVQADSEGAGTVVVPHALANMGHGLCRLHLRLLFPREVTLTQDQTPVKSLTAVWTTTSLKRTCPPGTVQVQTAGTVGVCGHGGVSCSGGVVYGKNLTSLLAHSF